jgi:preprotein translocase subunit SecG
MSTSSTEPTLATENLAEPTSSTSEGTLANVEPTEADAPPGFLTRHTAMLIALMVAVIVAAIAIAGVMLYKNHVDQQNSRAEAAFAKNVAAQGATLETVECNGGTCAAVINGQAYTVLVQKDAQGKQHFGVSAYAGN